MDFKILNTSKQINRLVECLENKNSNKPEEVISFFSKMGLIGLPVLTLLSVIFCIAMIAKGTLPVGVCIVTIFVAVIACVLYHYAADTMLPALPNLIKNSPTKISSASLLKVFAVFVAAFGIFSLIFGVYYSIVLYSNVNLFIGLFFFVFSSFWAYLLIKPEVLNVEVIEKTSVGEEFIGLTSFFAKGCVKLTPVVFGLSIFFAVIQMLTVIFASYVPIESILLLMYLSAAAFLPLVMYVAFLSYFFTLDILNAILSLPAKIDSLKK